jgi:hypothetical protein
MRHTHLYLLTRAACGRRGFGRSTDGMTADRSAVTCPCCLDVVRAAEALLGRAE